GTTKPDLIGISLRNVDDVLIRKQELFVNEIADLVDTVHKKWACPVVLGGSGYSILPVELLELTGADFGIVGEGEAALPALIDALETGGDLDNIQGLALRREGRAFLSCKPASSAPLMLQA